MRLRSGVLTTVSRTSLLFAVLIMLLGMATALSEWRADPVTAATIEEKIIVGAQANAGNDPLRVLDGNLSTSWAVIGDGVTPPKPAYLQLDLGKSTRLTKIAWAFRSTGYADRMRIRVSTDGVNYVTIHTTGNAPAKTWRELAVSQQARYVRFNVDNPN